MPPSGVLPPLNRLLEVFGFHLPTGTRAAGLPALRRSSIGVVFYVRRLAHPLRLRPAHDRASTRRPPAPSGVNPKAMILKTMLLSGGVAGLVGMGPLLADPQFHKYGDTFPTATRLHRHRRRPARAQHPGRHRRRRVRVGRHRAGGAGRCAPIGIPQEIVQILQGTLLLSAVIAFEVVAPLRRRRRGAGRGRAQADAGADRRARPDAEPADMTASRHRRRRRAEPGRPRSLARPSVGRPALALASLAVLVLLRRRASSPTRRDLTSRGHVRRRRRRVGADPARRPRRPVLRARRHREHRPRGHDDPRHVVRAAGPAGSGGRGPALAVGRHRRRARRPAPRPGHRHVRRRPRSWPASPSTSSRPASRASCRARCSSAQADGTITQSPTMTGSIGRFTVPFLSGGELFGWRRPTRSGGWTSSDWFFVSDLAGLLQGPHHEHGVAHRRSPSLLVPFTAYLLWRTAFGLRLRSVGEKPAAADSLGVPVYRMKYSACASPASSPASAGRGSPSTSGRYNQGQTAGRGFQGLAALIFGNWRPLGIACGAGLFAYAPVADAADRRRRRCSPCSSLAAVVFAGVAVRPARRASCSTGARRCSSSPPCVRVYYAITDDGEQPVRVHHARTSSRCSCWPSPSQRLRPPAADGQPWRKGSRS